MLKKIPTQQVQLGMYLQSMEGSWLSHPFWKTKFVLREQLDLDALLGSGVPSVWIDISKGCDVSGTEVLVAEPAVPVPVPSPPSVTPQRVAPPSKGDHHSLAAEMERATQLVNRSRQAVISLFGEARLGKVVNSEQCLPLVEDVANSVARNPSALISLARLKTKDDYTYMHSVAVCALMVGLARQLGLDAEQTREAGLAGLLHDIGKMMMPLSILNKPGQLTDEEFGVMRSHPVRGYQALKEGGRCRRPS